MRIFLPITGIVIIVAAVLSVLFAALNLFGYSHTQDGSHELYARMQRRAAIFFTVGAVSAAVAVVCLIVRTRL